MEGQHSLTPPPFKGVGEGGGGGQKKLKKNPGRGGNWKIKKGGGSMIFTSRNYFTLCKIVFCISKKIPLFCHLNFIKKGHSKLSKNEPVKISHKLR